MKMGTKSKKDISNGAVRRYILLVDGDGGAAPLKAAWRQLRLCGDLPIVPDPEKAVSLLREVEAGTAAEPVGAVVLDPETTGEGTGDFLRRARETSSGNPVPIVFWCRDREKCRALEGRGLASIVPKPMVLRVIQALDKACGLRKRPFVPFASGTLARQQARGNNGATA